MNAANRQSSCAKKYSSRNRSARRGDAGCARSYLFDVVGDLWATLVNGQQPSAVQQARFLSAYTHVVGECAAAVQLVFKASGGTAVYQSGALDRCLRDVLTMPQHFIGSLRTYEMAGRLLLGLEPLRWLF